MTTRAKLIQSLNGLSEAELERVLDFLNTLEPGEPRPQRGSAAAVLRAAGSWWMKPQDTTRFLQELCALRDADIGRHAIPPEY